MPPNTDPTPQEPIYFRVAAIERFAHSGRMKRRHLQLRVEYLNLEDTVRGMAFDLPLEQYRADRDDIEAALTSSAVYWVDRDEVVALQHGEPLVGRLLGAIRDRQIVPEEPEE